MWRRTRSTPRIPSLVRAWSVDKSNTMIFDNTKLRTLVPTFNCPTPFSQGAREIVDWYDADESRRTVDDKVNALQDRLIEAYRPGKVQPAG